MSLTLDLSRDLVVHWPAAPPEAAPLLRQLEARALLTEPASLSPKLAGACSASGLALLADLPLIEDLNALRQALKSAASAGFTAAAVTATGDSASFRALLAEFPDFVAIVYLAAEQIDWDVKPAHAVLRFGVWPGVAPVNTESAGATASVWLDANTSLVAQLRAQYPRRRAVLGYRPDKDGGVPEKRSVPATSAEVALADAFSAGGNVVLSLPVDYRAGLLAQAPRALDSWKSLATVHSFVRAQRALTDSPFAGHIAVLCGTIEQSAEILNLAFRRNLCPVAVPAATPPEFSTSRFDVVVAANVEMTPAVIENVARFATNGGAVMAAPVGDEKSPWWTTRGWKTTTSEQDRDLYTTGKGLLYAYHNPILDPGAFALDLRDLAGLRSQPEVGLKNFDLRIMAADTVLGVLHRPSPSTLAVVLTAYGGLRRHELLLSVRGRFRRGALREVGKPAASPVTLMSRTDRVEINLTLGSRIAIVTLEV
jgi:hypothetical protein